MSLKHILYTTVLLLMILISAGIIKRVQESKVLIISIDKSTPDLSMPIVENDPYAHLAANTFPIPNRGIEYRKWLQVSLRIHTTGSSGSGTIIYYDDSTNWAYVQTCGHLWGGMSSNMSSEQTRRRNLTCNVVAFYHNDKKLNSPQTYKAEVLYYNNVGNSKGTHDVALLRFKPNWIPSYFPIAPEDYKYIPNTRLYSTGCDRVSETACYNVNVIGYSSNIEFPSLVTRDNSPRPGRSGGGLMSDRYFVGVCWGTADTSGRGNGFFTPLKTVRYYNNKYGFGWLNEVGTSLARKIPIVDRNNPQGKYEKDYIPLPGGR